MDISSAFEVIPTVQSDAPDRAADVEGEEEPGRTRDMIQPFPGL